MSYQKKYSSKRNIHADTFNLVIVNTSYSATLLYNLHMLYPVECNISIQLSQGFLERKI